MSEPVGLHGGVVRWDFGKMEKEGIFRRTGTLDKPPPPRLHPIQALKSKHLRKVMPQFLQEMLSRFPDMAKEFVFSRTRTRHAVEGKLQPCFRLTARVSNEKLSAVSGNTCVQLGIFVSHGFS